MLFYFKSSGWSRALLSNLKTCLDPEGMYVCMYAKMGARASTKDAASY